MFFDLRSGQGLILFHRNYKWRLLLLVSGFYKHVSIHHCQLCISQLEKKSMTRHLLEKIPKSFNFNQNTNSNFKKNFVKNIERFSRPVPAKLWWVWWCSILFTLLSIYIFSNTIMFIIKIWFLHKSWFFNEIQIIEDIS